MLGLRTLRRLSWRDRMLLIEAALWLTAASSAIALLPFRQVRRIAERPVRPRRAAPAERAAEIRRVRWSITAVARRAPWPAKCFQQGLAAHCMLRRRGVASVLCYGAAPDAARGLVAHVWVRAGNHDVIGGEAAARFALLAAFPPE